jgi:Fe2+ transport system protein B
MAQKEDVPVVSKALFDLAVEQIQALGAIVKAQQEQITNLHLELRDRLDRMIRIIYFGLALLVAALFTIIRLTFMVLR